uniref:Uncharacterized protein n=1 Tax=Yersinia enterocolitica TaxID=630 RepID=B0RL20_YEREN|nr:hypothetical protein [Yersinia enterocolitica]
MLLNNAFCFRAFFKRNWFLFEHIVNCLFFIFRTNDVFNFRRCFWMPRIQHKDKIALYRISFGVILYPLMVGMAIRTIGVCYFIIGR